MGILWAHTGAIWCNAGTTLLMHKPITISVESRCCKKLHHALVVLTIL